MGAHPEFVLVRFHGRNAAAYDAPAKTAGERFDYDYSQRELVAIAEDDLPGSPDLSAARILEKTGGRGGWPGQEYGLP